MLPPPEHLVCNGKPQFGTFSGYPKRLDIRGVEAPFGLPLPHFITNFRIKSSLMFFFNIGEFVGTVDFFDGKLFGYAEVTFWNKKTKRKFSYRTLMGPRRRFIPHHADSGYCASFGKKRYIRISWDHSRDRLSMIFNLAGDSARPSVNAAFISHYQQQQMCEVTTVTPSPTRRRCLASYTATPLIHGSLSLSATRLSEAQTMCDTDGDALFSITRNYYNFLSETEFICAAGKVGDKHVSFKIVTYDDDAVDIDKENENLLFVDGECTPLPPVKITHPFGFAKNWIIQDMENMVDLTFTPVSDNFRDMTFFIVRTKQHTIFGTLEGVLKTKDGEDIPIHGFEALAKNQVLRL